MRRPIVAALGPEGTCGEFAANAYLRARWGAGSPRLCPTFEDAVALVLDGEADEVLVPAAWTNFHELVFTHIGRLQLREMLYSQHHFVAVARRGVRIEPREAPYRVAAHPSPSPLLRQLAFPVVRVHASSNAMAARMAALGEVDLAITNTTSFAAQGGLAGAEPPLEIVRSFGTIEMIWALFGRARDGRRPDFWRARFPAEAAETPAPALQPVEE